MGDFNPGFSFDAGDLAAPSQAPWEFGGAALSSSLCAAAAAAADVGGAAAAAPAPVPAAAKASGSGLRGGIALACRTASSQLPLAFASLA